MNILRQYGDISPASLDEACKSRYVPLVTRRKTRLLTSELVDCSLTDYCKRENVSPAEAAERMRAQVLAETGLSVSAGVSPNAMISKVAAVSFELPRERMDLSLILTPLEQDENKPNGQCVIDPTPEACKAFTSKLAIRKIPGIGCVCNVFDGSSRLADAPLLGRRVTERILQAVGVETVGDVYRLRGQLFLIVRHPPSSSRLAC